MTKSYDEAIHDPNEHFSHDEWRDRLRHKLTLKQCYGKLPATVNLNEATFQIRGRCDEPTRVHNAEESSEGEKNKKAVEGGDDDSMDVEI